MTDRTQHLRRAKGRLLSACAARAEAAVPVHPLRAGPKSGMIRAALRTDRLVSQHAGTANGIPGLEYIRNADQLPRFEASPLLPSHVPDRPGLQRNAAPASPVLSGNAHRAKRVGPAGTGLSIATAPSQSRRRCEGQMARLSARLTTIASEPFGDRYGRQTTVSFSRRRNMPISRAHIRIGP